MPITIMILLIITNSSVTKVAVTRCDNWSLFLSQKVMTFLFIVLKSDDLFVSHHPTDYHHHSHLLLLSTRFSSVLVNSCCKSSRKICRFSLGCHPLDGVTRPAPPSDATDNESKNVSLIILFRNESLEMSCEENLQWSSASNSVPDMTCNVFGETLSLIQSINPQVILCHMECMRMDVISRTVVIDYWLIYWLHHLLFFCRPMYTHAHGWNSVLLISNKSYALNKPNDSSNRISAVIFHFHFHFQFSRIRLCAYWKIWNKCPYGSERAKRCLQLTYEHPTIFANTLCRGGGWTLILPTKQTAHWKVMKVLRNKCYLQFRKFVLI